MAVSCLGAHSGVGRPGVGEPYLQVVRRKVEPLGIRQQEFCPNCWPRLKSIRILVVIVVCMCSRQVVRSSPLYPARHHQNRVHEVLRPVETHYRGAGHCIVFHCVSGQMRSAVRPFNAISCHATPCRMPFAIFAISS